MNGISSVLYQNQADKYPQIQKDFENIRKSVEKNSNSGHFGKLSELGHDVYKFENAIKQRKKFNSLWDVIPMFRRTERVPDKISKSEYVPAVGLVSLAILNGPEDMRDVMTSCRQMKSKLLGKEFKPKYDYTKMQHPFSFFRGTLLQNFADPLKSPFPNVARWLLKNDKTLYDTQWGGYLASKLGMRTVSEATDIRNMRKKAPFTSAIKFKNCDIIGELTTRALLRTTKLGAIALGMIEGAHFIKELRNGKNLTVATKQSVVTYTSSIVGIGYGGAIGAKYLGPMGSLIGMGVGARAGNKIAPEINKHFELQKPPKRKRQINN